MVTRLYFLNNLFGYNTEQIISITCTKNMRRVFQKKKNEKRTKSMHGMNILLKDVLQEEIRIEWVVECYELDENVKDIKILPIISNLYEGLCCKLLNSIHEIRRCFHFNCGFFF